MNRSPFRPHWFELYASEQLTSALRPALRYTLEVLSVRNPCLLPIAARSDEIFTSISLVLESSQLALSAATLSESFYGLKRARSFTPTAGRRLPAAQVAASVVFTVLLPYVKLKLDNAYSSHSGGPLAQLMGRGASLRSESALNVGERQEFQGEQQAIRRPRSLRDLAALIRLLAARYRVKERFIDCYPTFNAGYEGLGLVFNIFYLFGHTRYFSPTLALQRLVVRRLTARELIQGVASANQGGSERQVHPAVHLTLSVAKHAFVASVFAFRFLEYYYAAESRAPQQSVIVPPAPEPLPVARGIDASVASSRVNCPLCGAVRVNAAACTTSGYVFCYTCIYSHLEKHLKCPVTLMPATTEDILRVYEEKGSSS